MKISVRSPEGIRHCEGCKGEHVGPRCPEGTSYIQRLRSAQIHGSVTPSKEKKNYYEDEGLKDIFGGDRKERREDMLDATDGRGYTTIQDLD